jgi:hypothetical protein
MRYLALLLLALSSFCCAQDQVFADSFDPRPTQWGCHPVRNNLAISFAPPIGGSDLKLRMAIEALPVRKGEPLIGALIAQGGTPPYSPLSIVRGSLPPGVSLDTATGLLSGTPTTVGHYAFLAKVADVALGTFRTTFAIDVIPAFVGTATTPPTAENTASYSYTFQVSGATGAVTWASSGSLPSGLSLNSAGVLSGTPNDVPGDFVFTATATDAGSGDSLPIHCMLTLLDRGEVAFDNTFINPVVGGTYLPFLYIGTPYSATVSISGGGLPPFRFEDTNGQLTSIGLSVNPTTGEVTGTITDPAFANTQILAEVIATDALGVLQITAQAALGVALPVPSTDGTLGHNSDLLIPTEQAVKTYVDAHAGGSATTANVPASVTLSAQINRFTAINVAGTAPAAPADFQEIEIAIEDASFTGCTFVAGAGQTVNGAASFAFAILPCIFRFRYNLAATNWFVDYYRIGDI